MWQYHLFIFNRPEGTDLAGVNLYPPPGRAPRMRRRDTLLLYLHQAGSAPLPEREQRALLDRLAKRYFSLSGSVTAALKTLAHDLNAFYLNRNRKLAAQGKQSVGWLAMTVWRGNSLYLALSGPMHAAVLGETTQSIHDAQMSGRGLGVGRVPRVYFASAEVQPGDVLVLAPQFPPAWDANILRLDANRRVSPLLRRMLSYGGVNLQGVAVQVRPGAGEVKRKVVSVGEVRSAVEAPEAGEAVEVPGHGEPARGPQAPAAAPLDHAAPPAPSQARQPQPAADKAPPVVEEAPAPPAAAARPTPPPSPSQPPPPAAAQPPRSAPARPRQAKRPRFPKPQIAVGETIRRVGAAVWRGAARILAPLGQAAREAFDLSPDEFFALPRSFMAVTAIAVPLVVVTIAVVVFFRQGRHQQYQAYFSKAQIEAQQALAIDEPVTRHNALEQALLDLETAQSYERTPESQALKEKVQQALDALDGVQRLAFVPISSRLPTGTRIKRLVVTGADMYALDEQTGGVFHLQRDDRTGRYKLDLDFRCSPGRYGDLQVGPLTDITPLPMTNPGYKLVGIDAQAHLVFCSPGDDPKAQRLPDLEALPWRRTVALDYIQGSLYVLDPEGNTVKVVGNGPLFDATPRNYFTQGAPPGLQTAIDMAVLRGDLYLLYQDGRVIRCRSAAAGEKVVCENLPYNDPRPGRQSGPVIPDVRFTQIRPQPPPDPSLYFLDVSQGAVYRFTLQLQFVVQYRPQEPLAAPVSAFAIDPDAHLLFWAAGDRIYQAPLD